MGISFFKEKGMLLFLLFDVNNKIEDKNDCILKILIYNKCVCCDIYWNSIKLNYMGISNW